MGRFIPPLFRERRVFLNACSAPEPLWISDPLRKYDLTLFDYVRHIQAPAEYLSD